MEIHYVTSNVTKFEEAQHILVDEHHKGHFTFIHSPIHLTEIQGTTEEIAFHKVKEAYSILKKPVIIDDISVSFPCLNGLPGPYIRTFLEVLQEEGIWDLISRYNDHRCSCLCTIAFFQDDMHTARLFEGKTSGTCVPPRGTLRHGTHSWNSIVQPDGHDRTFAEMTLKEVSTISPRNKALEKLKTYLMAAY